MSLRKDHRHFLIGPSVTIDDKDIKGSKLPSKRQVIRCFLYYKDELQNESSSSSVKQLLRRAAQKVVDQVLVYYGKARIPTIAWKKMVTKVIDYYEEMKQLLKIPHQRRDNILPKQRIERFIAELDASFVFWVEMH